MISVFGWPDPNMGFDQSEHALYTCYFIKNISLFNGTFEQNFHNSDFVSLSLSLLEQAIEILITHIFHKVLQNSSLDIHI